MLYSWRELQDVASANRRAIPTRIPPKYNAMCIHCAYKYYENAAQSTVQISWNSRSISTAGLVHHGDIISQTSSHGSRFGEISK